MSRLLLVFLVGLFALLQYRLWIADGGFAEIYRLHQDIARYQQRNAELKARNDALEAEINDLKQGLAATEERARSDLGYIKPDEEYYLILPKTPQTHTQATQKEVPQ